jgi:hypothetical protein
MTQQRGQRRLAAGLGLAEELDVGPLRRRELTAAGHERIERTLDEAERDRPEEALRALLATLEDRLER